MDDDLFQNDENWRHPDEMGSGFVYFFLAPLLSRLKIGRSRKAPWARLDTMNTGSPERLIPALILRCDMRLEEFLHQGCSGHRVHGEWFSWPEVTTPLTEWFLCYGGDVECEWVSGCPVGDALRACIPNVKWPSDSGKYRKAIAGNPSKKSASEYARHTAFRGILTALSVGESLECEDDGERSISYAIAKSAGITINARRISDQPKWTITRTA